MGVPELRALFREVFGQDTASNNSAWLRKKLAEPPAPDEGGARRAAIPRARDVSASIWSKDDPAAACLEGGSGGFALPFMPRMMRPDPCLLDAKAFISQGRNKAKAAAAAAAATAAATAAPAQTDAEADAKGAVWAAKRCVSSKVLLRLKLALTPVHCAGPARPQFGRREGMHCHLPWRRRAVALACKQPGRQPMVAGAST